MTKLPTVQDVVHITHTARAKCLKTTLLQDAIMPQTHSLKYLFHTYSANALSYNLGQEKSEPICPLDQASINNHVDKIIRLSKNSNRPYIVLFGAGDGRLAKNLIEDLAKMNAEPENNHLNPTKPTVILCELNPHRIREAISNKVLPPLDLFAPQNQEPSINILVDTSARALLLLLAGCGISLENSFFYLHPGLPTPETNKLRAAMQLLQRSRVCSELAPEGSAPSVKPKQLPDQTLTQAVEPAPNLVPNLAPGTLSILAILHPEETQINEFCAHIPPQVKELVIVWDSDSPINKQISCPCPLIQKNRPLAGNFAKQRNYALSFCTAPWVLALDADERLAPESWQQVLALTAQNDISAAFLPRLTLYPNEGHFRTGFGLWPDPQLRLFKQTQSTCFNRPVHEILEGVEGPQVLLLHSSILHYSYILKNRERLQERLAVFNQAAGREVHKLSQEYPFLPLTWYAEFQKISAPIKYIILPKD